MSRKFRYKMHKLSIIILSYAIDSDIYDMNCQCLNSLFESEEWQKDELEVLLIESNTQSAYQYDERVRVLIPGENFNFHRFLNIGVSATIGEFLAFCNNDIIFQSGWWTAIKHVKNANPKFMCFSPLDRSYPMMTEEQMPSTMDYYIGWENKRHFAAWCFVWERKVFDIIGPFDELYDFYSADGDELLTLRKYALPNVLVTHSEVKHLSQVVTKKMDEQSSPVIPQEIRDKYPLTDEEIRRGWTWLWEDIRFYEAYQKDKQKWGHWRVVKRINRLFDEHPCLHVRPISMFLYNRRVNVILSKIFRMKW